MRKRMTVIAALMLCSTAMTPALAQNCTSSTRCDELGYTMSKKDCDGIKSLVCPFDNSKYFCVGAGYSAADAQPGMILYSDGTLSYSVIPSKTAVGIVAYVDESRRFAVALAETAVEWGGDGYDVSCLTNMGAPKSDFNGAANTQCLINDSQSHPAAEYCNSYKPVSSGTGSSGWYLPAAGELYVMNFSYGAINLGLQKLSKMQLNNNYYWSSSESDYTMDLINYYAWAVRPSDGGMDTANRGDKSYNFNSVRCVLAF